MSDLKKFIKENVQKCLEESKEQRLRKFVRGKINEVFNEGDAFNDAGEPVMTHSQFRGYSEPSEQEFDDMAPDRPIDPIKHLQEELEKNNILLEFAHGQYFIRCIGENDFSIDFDKSNTNTITAYVNEEEFSTNMDDVHEMLEFILSQRDILMSFDKAVKEHEAEKKIEMWDKQYGY